MVTYDVLLANKYFLRNVIEEATLEDGLDQISYDANITIVLTPDFPGIEVGQSIAILGPMYGTTKQTVLFDGIVWEFTIKKGDNKENTMLIHAYDRTIYLSKSKAEYVWKVNTATQRIEKYCSDFGIQHAAFLDTNKQLS